MRVAAIQAKLCHKAEPRLWPTALSTERPRARMRKALIITVKGWWVAKPCSHDGIVEMGTNADETKVRGKTQIKPKACTDSSSFTARPI